MINYILGLNLLILPLFILIAIGITVLWIQERIMIKEVKKILYKKKWKQKMVDDTLDLGVEKYRA